MSNKDAITRAMDGRYMLTHEIATRCGLDLNVVRRNISDLEAEGAVQSDAMPYPIRERCYRLVAI